MTYDEVVDWIDDLDPYYDLDPSDLYDLAVTEWVGRNELQDIMTKEEFLTYFETENLTLDDKILYSLRWFD